MTLALLERRSLRCPCWPLWWRCAGCWGLKLTVGTVWCANVVRCKCGRCTALGGLTLWWATDCGIDHCLWLWLGCHW